MHKVELPFQELRAAFEAEGVETGRERMLLTAAVAAGKPTIDTGYEIDKISMYVVMIMLSNLKV